MLHPFRVMSVFAIFVLATGASAIDYRWTLGFAQGTSEAIIRNASGSSLNIYCPSGQTDTTPGMFIHVERVRPKPREQIEVQIVVDGRNHPFYLQESEFKAAGRANESSLYSLVQALAKSRAKDFVVEFLFSEYLNGSHYRMFDELLVLMA